MKKFYEKKKKEIESREASKEDQLGIFFFVVFTEVVININAQIVPS